MRKISNFLIIFLIASFFLLPVSANAEKTMAYYCTVPPFLKSNAPSNLMFILDYSGSMSYPAYFSYQSEYPLKYYNSSKTYYGYFITNKNYEEENGIWEITNNSGKCNVYCYSGYNNSNYYVSMCDAYGTCKGNLLNFIYMTRIDILKWILTGGEVIGNYCEQKQNCDDFSLYQCTLSNYHDNMCAIYSWFFSPSWCGNNKLCNSFTTQEKCAKDNYHDNMCGWVKAKYVETNNKVKIKIEDVSTYNKTDKQVEGILQQLQKDPNRPRIATEMFGGEVYGYTPFSTDYGEAVQEINKIEPYGTTATKDAVTLAENVFKESNYYINYFKDPYKIDGKTIPCIKNFIILISDGEWNEPDESEDSDPVPVIDTMWKGGNADLVKDIQGNQKAETFSISAFMDSTQGENALKWMATYGNYRDLNGNGYPCDMSSYPDTSLTTNEDLENTCLSGEVKKNTNKNGPYGFFEGNNPSELKSAITSAINEVIKKVSSSTAASVVSTNEKSGANILQAVFWAKRYFDGGTSADWVGSLYNLWLYLGYYASSQEIRENSDTTNETNAIKYLTLNDKVIQFYHDGGTVKVEACDDKTGNGDLTNCVKGYSISDVKNIWNAGLELWKTNPNDRYIFTDVSCPNVGNEGNFVDNNASCLMPYLDVNNITTAKEIIDWVRGYHVNGFRSRVVTIGGETHVWKLGDIVDSTPKVLSIMPVNSYYEKYNDTSYYNYNFDSNGNSKHADRGMVFVGANDGMMHAFRLGALSYPGGNVLAELKENGGALGSESWAFIPKNVLPYLKYLVKPSYCHMYSVDLTPFIIDASVNGGPSENKTANSWRTILVGGMNLGGATGVNSSSAVQPPMNGLGYSSYFAIDVTDTEHPKVLWDFTDKDLGFTTTGVDIVHIPYNNNNNKNGYWYAVFASGPDNYDGTTHHPLYLYVVNLVNGKLIAKIQISGQGKPIPQTYAFAGRMFTASADLGRNYSDDAIFIGFSYYNSSNNQWKGGVLRINTLNNPDPNRWQASTLISGIGPVTSTIVPVEDQANNALWLIFGTGRYFYRGDDLTAQRRIFGVKDPCYLNGAIKNGCQNRVSLSNLVNVTNNSNANIGSQDGWYVNLELSTGSYGSERVITDPSVSSSGNVIFATFMPSSDICAGGGNMYLWLVKYNNGGQSSLLNGKILIQSSTGEIVGINEKTSFGKATESQKNSYGGRRTTTPITGSPPLSGGLTSVITPQPIGKNLLWYAE